MQQLLMNLMSALNFKLQINISIVTIMLHLPFFNQDLKFYILLAIVYYNEITLYRIK